jgi:chromosome segregation ATPase
MHSLLNQKLALTVLSTTSRRITCMLLLLVASLPVLAQQQAEPKAKWYRYYDSRGIANISTSVTPNHIRHGYEALDQNMQVIKKARPYNTEADIRQAPQRAAEAKRQAEDNKLKSAYTNSTVAAHKRKAALESIKKQIIFQQDQLKQLQNDRIMFKRQEMEISRKGKNIPKSLKDTLDYNEKNINEKKQTIHSLQTRYRKTQTDYDQIIARLKTLESQ